MFREEEIANHYLTTQQEYNLTDDISYLKNICQISETFLCTPPRSCRETLGQMKTGT